MKNIITLYSEYNYGNELLIIPESSDGIILSNEKYQLKHKDNILKLEKTLDNNLLYWFRWIISHHTNFLIWLLVDKYLKNAITKNFNQERYKKDMQSCFLLLELSSCMYIYASSVLESTYNEIIRKFMSLYHAAFTAKWAKDYHTLKSTIKNYFITKENQQEIIKIKNIFENTKIVHHTIASKLVHDRKSLLYIFNSNNKELDTSNTEAHWKIYDCFFIVNRVNQIEEKELIYSLLKRLFYINLDITSNGLFNKKDNIEILLKNNVTNNYINNFNKILKLAIKNYTY